MQPRVSCCTNYRQPELTFNGSAFSNGSSATAAAAAAADETDGVHFSQIDFERAPLKIRAMRKLCGATFFLANYRALGHHKLACRRAAKVWRRRAGPGDQERRESLRRSDWLDVNLFRPICQTTSQARASARFQVGAGPTRSGRRAASCEPPEFGLARNLTTQVLGWREKRRARAFLALHWTHFFQLTAR